MNTQRLTVLSRYLQYNVEDDRFDLAEWVRFGALDISCGAVACALGHATNIREFQKAGLCLVDNIPSFGGETGFSAAALFFELTHSQVIHLFHSSSYSYRPKPTRYDVIARIRRLLECPPPQTKG